MRRLFIVLVLAGIPALLQAWCGGGCSEGQTTKLPGPEITGNYAYPYLQTSDGGYVADPMYYYADGALEQWHKIRARAASIMGPPGSASRCPDTSARVSTVSVRAASGNRTTSGKSYRPTPR